MQTRFSRSIAALAATLALSLSPTPAQAALERVGPNSPTNFLPLWYQDKTGLTFEFCTPLNQAEYAGGWCLLLPTAPGVPGNIPGDVVPEVFPGAFSGEHFYFATDNKGNYAYVQQPGGPTPAATSGKVTVTMAVEAAFLGAIGPGLGQVFGRIRVKVTPLPLTGNYRVYTPYNVQDIAGLAGDKIFVTEDIGTNCAAFTYDCALQTSIGPFLIPSNTPGGAELPPVTGPVAGKLYLADPARLGPVTGSPNGTYTLQGGRVVNANVVVIEAPDGQVIYESYDFSSMGRVMTDVIPSRLSMNRASYARDAGASIRVDAYATGEPTLQPRLPAAAVTGVIQPQLSFYDAPCGGTPDVNGVIQPPYTAPAGQVANPMSHSGNVYWGAAAPAAVPAGACLVDLNAHTAGGAVVPTYLTAPLGDQVFVTAAVYDPTNGGSLSVRASSSDVLLPPALTLGAFGSLPGNVPLVDDLAYVTPLAAPPATVRVYSQEGGSAELQVKVGSRAATGVTLTADRSSPLDPGTAVIFTAQATGATEYLYRFWLDSGSGFGSTPVRDWSTSPTWALPGNTPVGHYRVMADVWAGLQPNAPDAASNVVTFDIRLPPATGVTLTANRQSPVPAYLNLPTVFTAAGSGSTAPYQYRFWLNSGGGFSLVQDYGVGSAWTMPATTPAGAYVVKVDVRTSTAVSQDVSTTLDFQLLAVSPATSLVVAANPAASTFAPGQIVVFTATAGGSTAGGAPTPASAYQYRYQLWDGTKYVIVKDYTDPSNAYTMTANSTPGSYRVFVETRTSAGVQNDKSAYYFFAVADPATTPTPATGLTVAANQATTIFAPGQSVVFTATGTGSTTGGAPSAPTAYQYRFQLWDGAKYTIVKDYTDPSNTFTMTTTTVPGTYRVFAETRTNTAVPNEAVAYYFFTVPSPGPVPTPATGLTVTASPSSTTYGPGQTVVFTAIGSGSLTNGVATDPATYQYRFQLWDGTKYTIVKDYAAPGNTYTMTTTSISGSYRVFVEVRTTSSVQNDKFAYYFFSVP